MPSRTIAVVFAALIADAPVAIAQGVEAGLVVPGVTCPDLRRCDQTGDLPGASWAAARANGISPIRPITFRLRATFAGTAQFSIASSPWPRAKCRRRNSSTFLPASSAASRHFPRTERFTFNASIGVTSGKCSLARSTPIRSLRISASGPRTTPAWVPFYRSQHELVCVFKSGTAPHRNNIELGKYGRYRTNLWNYSGASSFGDGRSDLALHPTVKPVALVEGARRDCSKRKDLILDPFAGSGTTLLAAERTGRVGNAIELDPRYCDVILRRLEATCGLRAVLQATGERFDAEEIGSLNNTQD